MIRIELNPNDKRDILRLFKICKDNPEIFYYERADFSNYWLMRIEQLEDAINGFAYKQSIRGSSFSTIDSKPINKYNEADKNNDLESELDVFDNK